MTKCEHHRKYLLRNFSSTIYQEKKPYNLEEILAWGLRGSMDWLHLGTAQGETKPAHAKRPLLSKWPTRFIGTDGRLNNVCRNLKDRYPSPRPKATLKIWMWFMNAVYHRIFARTLFASFPRHTWIEQYKKWRLWIKIWSRLWSKESCQIT